MRFFYVAVAETRASYLEAMVEVVSRWDAIVSKHGVRVGLLLRFTNWRSRPCIPCKLAAWHGLPVFIDNGAFSYLKKGLDRDRLNAWVIDYARWLDKWWVFATAWALPDLPVHGREFYPRDVRIRLIKETHRLQSYMARLLGRWNPDALSRAVIVLQGYTLDEYRLSRLLADDGETPELMETCTMKNTCPYYGVWGVGSVCVRKNSAKGKTGLLAEGKASGSLNEFLANFLETAPTWGVGTNGFHFFGLHAEAVAGWGRHPRFFAADSGAHGLNYKYKSKTVLDCEDPSTPKCYAKAVDHQLRITLTPLLSKPIIEYYA